MADVQYTLSRKGCKEKQIRNAKYFSQNSGRKNRVRKERTGCHSHSSRYGRAGSQTRFISKRLRAKILTLRLDKGCKRAHLQGRDRRVRRARSDTACRGNAPKIFKVIESTLSTHAALYLAPSNNKRSFQHGADWVLPTKLGRLNIAAIIQARCLEYSGEVFSSAARMVVDSGEGVATHEAESGR